MENNNSRTPGATYPANGQTANAPPLFADVARSSSTAPVATPVTPPTTPGPVAPQKPPRNARKLFIRIGIIVLIVGLIIAGVMLLDALRNRPQPVANSAVNRSISNTTIPLSDLTPSSLSLLGTQSLTVNGQLRANEALVVSPSAQPTKAEKGQIYYDKNANQLAYYNGSGYILLGNQSNVRSLGGLAGQLTLGNGLATGANNQITNSGVLSIQGQTGNITLVAGAGITLDGTTLTNTGVVALGGKTGSIVIGNGLSIASGSLQNTGVVSVVPGSNIAVTNDGAGNVTISSSAGGGNVNTAGGTSGKIAKFVGVQAIADSLLSESGTTVTVGGDLTVSGNIALSSALGVTNGGTGATSLAANGIVIGQGSGALTAITAASSGMCLLSTSGTPSFGACPSSGVASVNGITGNISLSDTTVIGSTIYMNSASTSMHGVAQFDSTNFTVTAGIANTIQDIHVAAAPTFGRLSLTSSQATSPMLLVNNTNATASGNLIDLQLSGASQFKVSPGGNMTLTGTVNGQTISSAASFSGTLAVTGATSLNGGASVNGTLTASTIASASGLSVGTAGQSLTLQGNASTTISANNAGNATTLSFQTPTANVNYRFLTAAAGTYDICTTVGNCAGVGGGVTTAGGTVNQLAKFTTTGAIGDSIISDNGTTASIAGVLAVNTITPTGTLTVGSVGQNVALQGANTTVSSTASGITNTLTFASPSGSNKTISLPNASGTVVVSASGPLSIDSSGNITCPTCAVGGSGVTSFNGLSGALSLANATGSGSTVTIQDASTGQKGLAQFNGANFSVSSGVVNTAQDIAVASTPTFGALTLSSSQSSSPMLLVNNTNSSASGNLIDLQVAGSSKLSVNPAGAMTVAGTINGQTISSSASFSGTLAVTGATSLNGSATVAGTLNANLITPTSSMTVGATNQAITVQGNASSTFAATSGANSTTLGFQTPTANVTYRLLTAAAGTYDICTTVGNCAGVGGGVTTAGGTAGRIAKFTTGSAIGDSIISDNGSTVTIGGVLAVNTITPSGALTIGASSQNLALQGAVTTLSSTVGGITNTLQFATPGASNKTITLPNASGTIAVSATGPIVLDSAGNVSCPTCALSGSGVTSLNGLTGALSVANATGTGGIITIQDASTAQKGIAQFNSTNFSVSSGTVNTIQDISLAAAPTFGRLTVTSSQATNGMLLVNNTNTGATGNLLDIQLNGASKLAVSPAGAMTLTGTINGQTISSTASFSGTLAVTGAASLNGGASVTGTLTANTITPTSSLTVGATGQSFLMQGNAGSTITATNGANTTTFSFQTPTANVTYRLLTAAAGTYDICTTQGNCAGVGGGVTTAGGTTGKIAKFTTSGAIGDSIISESGTTITIGGTLAVNTITPAAAMTIGATTQDVTLQGATTQISASASGITNTLTFATPSGSNKTITVPNASGTVAVSASGPLSIDASGNITCPTCVTSGGSSGGSAAVDSVNGLTGALTIANATGSGSTITINDASTSQKGIAQFNSTNFSASGGVVNTVQDINVSAAPTFGRLTVTSSQASNAMLLVNNTNSSGTGNLLDVQLNGASKLAVSPAGAMTVAGAINGQTISSTASFSGTLAVTGAASLNGGASVTGTLTANTITPTSSLTVGAMGQSFLVQGSSSSTITATSGADTTTVAFQAPTASVTYRFLTTAAGTYDVCTTVGNCAGVGGGVTTAGGTTGTIAKFTASGAIGNSLLTESGSTITVGGTLAVNTLTPTAALTVGANSQDLTLQGAVVNLKSTASGITNTLTFATPSGSNKTITIPNASGTLVVSASGPLSIDTAGNISCPTCAVSGSGVTSLNSLTGTLSIANASGSGSTITINDASTAQKGIAQFNSTNFSASGGVINTIQNINSSAAPTFGQLTLTSSQASAAMLTINNTNTSATGNLIDLQLNGSSKLSVTPAGAMTIASTINGQTISSTASLTGTLAVAGSANLNGGASVTGTLTTNTITPTSNLTVGATSQTFLLQGSSSSTITATNGANTTAVAFETPTANVTYRLRAAAVGTYDICTTVGNCAGAGSASTLQAAYDAGNTITTSNNRDVAITLADTATDSNFTVTTATNSTGFTTFARADGTGTADPTQLVLLTNLDTDRSLPIGLAFGGNIGTDIYRGSGTLTLQGNGGMSLTSANTTGASGGITIQSGNSTSGNAGTITIDTGTTSAVGQISVGATHATQLTVGNSAATLTLQGSSSSVIKGISGSFVTTLGFTAPTANHSINLPDASGTICLDSGNCAAASSILNQNSSDQTANFRISGTGRANTSLLTPLLDTATGGTLNIGTNNATSISLNQNTAVSSSKTFTAGVTTIQPASNNTSALKVNDQNSNTVFNVDVTNRRVGVNTSSPAATFDVTQSSSAPGTVSNSASSANVTGSSTTFLSTFSPGDTLTVTSSGNSCTVKQITSDTALVCSNTLASSSSGSTYSFTPKSRLNVNNNGVTNVTGNLEFTNNSSSTVFSMRNDPADGTFKLGTSSIGNSSQGNNDDSGNSAYVGASQFNSGTGGTLSSLKIYLSQVAAAPYNHARGAIYQDSGGSPGALMSSAAATSITATAGWNTLPLGTTVTLAPNTTYWLAFKVDSDSTFFSYVGGSSGDSVYLSASYSSNFPGPFGTPSVTGTFRYSIYGAYNTITDQSAIKGAINVGDNNAVTVRPLWDTDNAFTVQSTYNQVILDVNTLNGTVGVNNLLINTATQKGLMTILSAGGVSASWLMGNSNQTVPVQVIQGGYNPGTGQDLLRFVDYNNTLLTRFDRTGTLITGGADYAEYFAVGSVKPVAGELVALDASQHVVRAATGSRLIGVVSTAPGIMGNGPSCKADDATCMDNYQNSHVAVALTGQVPVKVSVANGAIHVGDPITASNKAGVGQLATSAGQIIGYAQQATATDATIPVLVQPGYFDPNGGVQGGDSTVDNLNVSGKATLATLDVSGSATIGDLTVNRNAEFKGNVTVRGLTSVADITINGHIVTGGSAPTTTVLSAAGTNASVTISGDDSAGTISITIGAGATADDLAKIDFTKAYGAKPNITISPVGAASAGLQAYIDQPNINSFSIGVMNTPKVGETYSFTYHTIQ